jgi:hypothetical protein
MIARLALVPALVAAAASGQRTSVRSPVQVQDTTGGCDVETVERTYEWRPDGDHYTWEGNTLTQALLDEFRRVVLATESDKTPDLLAVVGFSQREIDAHRDRILETLNYGSRPDSCWRGTGMFDFDSARRRIESELHDRIESDSTDWCTDICRLRVTLPGTPEIVVESNQATPLHIPWTITVGDRRWKTTDITVSRSIQPWLDHTSPNYYLAASHYWSSDVWHDPGVWMFEACDRAAASEFEPWFASYAALPGYDETLKRLHLFVAGSSRDSAYFILSPGTRWSGDLIDRMHWRVPLHGGEPTSDWRVCRRRFDDALGCASKLPWLSKWKALNRWRVIILDLPDPSLDGDQAFDASVTRAWRQARLPGAPEFEFALIGGGWQATVYATRAASVALVSEADQKMTSIDASDSHWLDELTVNLHSPARTFASVDANGERTLGRLDE